MKEAWKHHEVSAWSGDWRKGVLYGNDRNGARWCNSQQLLFWPCVYRLYIRLSDYSASPLLKIQRKVFCKYRWATYELRCHVWSRYNLANTFFYQYTCKLWIISLFLSSLVTMNRPNNLKSSKWRIIWYLNKNGGGHQIEGPPPQIELIYIPLYCSWGGHTN